LPHRRERLIDWMVRSRIVDRAVVIVSWCAVITVLVTAVLVVTPRLRWWQRGSPDLVYERGTRIDLPPRLYDNAEVTAVLFVRGSCAVCQETKPLYADVVRELRAIPSVKVMAVLAAPLRDEDAEYAAALGLDRSESVAIELTGLKVRRVPTLAIVTRDGTIVDSWEGAPPLSERSGFASTVRASVQH
jgi:thiol-disulfide isomerase/thioredoxin